ncbi:acetyl-CoA carboxylase biotin carboxylase subunit family protein [Kitasatospora sp. NPDC058190]|uniref:ATP-grasp domain-containing protein n=1 Tax=Kitasatospora sp. NPDC058190 TaxID=3346371 RepID=UPI0036D8D31C
MLVIHRWRDRYADYAGYLDHATHHVSYLTTSLGRESVPAEAAAVVVVDATDDLAAVRGAAEALVARFGRPAALVALNEGDLDTAAVLRAELGCPGRGPAEQDRFRDKLAMVSAAARAGVAVPAFADAPGPEAVREFGDRHGWPIVLKPRRGTASRGVRILGSAAELDEATAALADEPHLVQSYLPDPIVHIDGLWDGTALGPWRASRYLNSCRAFNDGAYLGSVELDDPELLAHLGEFTARAVAALDPGPWVFHLEAFVADSGAGTPRITFLEAGARVGGAEIPFLWREVHGIDLMALAFDLQLGRPPAAVDPSFTESAGWLLAPLPVEAPCQVVEVSPAPDGPYAQVVPAEGAVIPKTGGYEHVGARFRFRGASSREVEAALERTAADFRLRCRPLPAPVPSH